MPRTPRRPGDPPARGRQPRKPKRPKVPRDAPLDVHWDDFYARRGGRFYKDRHWLRRELPELMPAAVRADPLRHQAPLESDGEAVDRSDAFPAARELARGRERVAPVDRLAVALERRLVAERVRPHGGRHQLGQLAPQPVPVLVEAATPPRVEVVPVHVEGRVARDLGPLRLARLAAPRGRVARAARRARHQWQCLACSGCTELF